MNPVYVGIPFLAMALGVVVLVGAVAAVFAIRKRRKVAAVLAACIVLALVGASAMWRMDSRRDTFAHSSMVRAEQLYTRALAECQTDVTLQESIQIRVPGHLLPEDTTLPPVAVVEISMDDGSVSVGIHDGAGHAVSVTVDSESAERSFDTVEAAVAEAIARLHHTFALKEPFESPPGLIVIEDTARTWLTEEQFASVKAALVRRGFKNRLVFDAEGAEKPDTYYEIKLEMDGTPERGALSARCAGYFPDDKCRTLVARDIRYGSPRQRAYFSSTTRGIIRQISGAGFLVLFIAAAYLFVDAGAHGPYTWPLRLTAAAGFAAVCLFLWYNGLPLPE